MNQDDLRCSRINEKRTIKELNNPGPRLQFCREKLGLMQKEIAEGVGIPSNTYCGREAGARTDLYEELLALALFLDIAWQNKYSKHQAYPMYQGVQLKKVSLTWVMFGRDEELENSQMLLDELKAKIEEIERDNILKEMELKRQLELFVDEVG